LKRTRVLAAIGAAAAAAALLLGAGTASAAAASPVIPSGPPVLNADGSMPGAHGGAKERAPQTDLAGHPKRTGAVPAQKAAAAKAAPEVQVYEVIKEADGSVSLGLYEPAAGVTPDQLVKTLHAKGKKNVVASTEDPGVAVNRALGVPAPDAAPETMSTAATNPNICQYGTARTVTCPVSYWLNNGLNHPNVRFNDHSGSAWPTNTAVYDWNQTQGIDSTYLWNECPFKAGARCVDVNSGNYGPDGSAGYAHLHWANGATDSSQAGAQGAFAEQGNWVELNDYYESGKNAQVHEAIVIHELGHVLGLSHNTCTCDVMRGTPLDNETQPPTYPSTDDYNQLANLYSVVR
jgi:hypothetical protein